jgi:arylsulfatase A-like enzyme
MHHVFLVATLALALCAASSAQINVLVIVADDVGVDMVGAYAEHPESARTPIIDQLAADGILFRNCWSDPTCSPTRATLLTGRYGIRSGIGRAIAPAADSVELSKNELSLPDALPGAYTSIALGKWHLSVDGGNGMQLPFLLGFEHHRGAPWNFPDAAGQVAYFTWSKSVDGVLEPSTVYATTDTVNDAIEFMEATPQPWFIYVAFNTAHSPAHKPPAELHTYELPQDIAADVPMHTRAMVQAMDTELGRMFATVDPAVLARTMIVFVGDNGTDTAATTAPFDPAHAKGTPYEGGVNVPLIIKGPGVLHGVECAGLVNTVDIFSTVLDHAGADVPPDVDGVSLVPYFTDPAQPSIRPWVYAQTYRPNGFGPYLVNARTVRGERYKLIREEGAIELYGGEALYDLIADPWEMTDLITAKGIELPEAQQAYAELSALLDSITGPWTDLGGSLPGVAGAPGLATNGTLLPGDALTLRLFDAAPVAAAGLVVGLDALQAAFKGGVMVPDPTGPGGQVLAFLTGGGGKLLLSATWPPAVPAGFEIFFQFWIMDAAAPQGYAASNAVRALTQ